MTDVAIVSYARHAAAQEDSRTEVEMLRPVLDEALHGVGLEAQDMGFVCSGSSDYLAGIPFAFVSALDAVGPWPPLRESHVEMDAAWALYEAWMRLQHGDIDTALVYGFGKSSPGDLPRVLALQTDPYHLAPLAVDAVSLAGLQARALLDAGRVSERDAAAIVADALSAAADDPYAVRSGRTSVDEVLAADRVADPLRELDCAPVTDGSSVMVLATAERARELTDTPVWLTGIEHRIESSALGARDLTDSPSTRSAAAALETGGVDIAELHAPFSYQQALLADVLGLDGARINPSGGALASNPMMAAGLDRIGQAAERLKAGEGRRALAHATSGPCLQQNLVATMEVGA